MTGICIVCCKPFSFTRHYEYSDTRKMCKLYCLGCAKLVTKARKYPKYKKMLLESVFRRDERRRKNKLAVVI